MNASPMEWIFRRVRGLGPYLAVELLLPGGSLLALLLWFFQNKHGKA